MAYSVRTAISLPKKDFQHLEALRKKLDKSRSEIYQDALRALLHSYEIQALEQRYVSGYRRKPEDPLETEGLFTASLSSFPKERW